MVFKKVSWKRSSALPYLALPCQSKWWATPAGVCPVLEEHRLERCESKDYRHCLCSSPYFIIRNKLFLNKNNRKKQNLSHFLKKGKIDTLRKGEKTKSVMKKKSLQLMLRNKKDLETTLNNYITNKRDSLLKWIN
jgi:hypothetical protein